MRASVERIGRFGTSADEAVSDAVAAAVGGARSAIVEAVAAVRASGGGGAKAGVRVTDDAPKAVYLRTETSDSVTYATLAAPSVSAADMTVSLDRVLTYLQIQTDMTLIRLSRERVEQNQRLYDVRHAQQLERIDAQMSALRTEDDDGLISKIFTWIGAVVTTVAAIVLMFIPGMQVMGGLMLAAAVFAIASAICTSTPVAEHIKDGISETKQAAGMSKSEADREATKILGIIGLALDGVSMLLSLCTVAAPVAAAKAAVGAAQAGAQLARVVKLLNMTAGVVAGVSAVLSGVEGLMNARRMRDAEYAQAALMRTEASLREAREFLAQNIDDVEVLLDQLNKHFQNLRAIVESHIKAMMTLARGVGA